MTHPTPNQSRISPSGELAIVATATSVPIALFGVAFDVTPAIIGAAIGGTLLYSIAGFMRWMDGR
ncbi:hypothetical protein [Micromonospora carbonacea]|uniref:hypothetical protein n=1 Tax=Micromonospora carbonacea TaxID=47853 RepID=UPI00370FC9FD